MDDLALRQPPRHHSTRLLVLAAVLPLLAGCGGQSSGPTTPTMVQANGTTQDPTTGTPVPTGATVWVLAGAGDIAACGSSLANAHATSKLLDAIDGVVFTVGDNTQVSGTSEEFANCYGPTWGRHRARTRATLGNHDFVTANGSPYYGYFGSAGGGPEGLGYYSYDASGWHVIALNSNLPVTAGSAQASWLEADLRANTAPCTLAYWHQPLFSSGPNGNNTPTRNAWVLLYAYGADVVLNGHDHLYERFAPQDPAGRSDLAHGIRQFTVGTGGASLYSVANLKPNSEVQASVYGILKLTLREGGYEWEFVGVPGSRFSDFGSGTCH